MAFFDFFNTAINYVFSPLLTLPTLWAVILLSLLISLLTTLIYKYTTDQKLMKDLKGEIKTLQDEAKQLKDNPQKAMDVQKQAMETNMKYMSHSMRPTLITFLPIILIFGWMTSHFAFEQILPDQEFSMTTTFQEGVLGNITINAPHEITVTGKTTREITGEQTIFIMKGLQGEHSIKFNTNGKEYPTQVLITKEKKYLQPQTTINDKIIKTITTDNKPRIVLNLFGWKLGWLGTYILSSILFSMLLRKWMKIY